MSGHSKWTQIKRQKGATDQKRGVLFTKLANAITIAAREKGGDPVANFKLRLAIDQAKAVNLPKDNIERAIKRGTGELEGLRVEEIIYEAFGPGGVGLVVQALTDNKNRTVSSLRHILNKNEGALAGQNSVLWKFDQKGILRLEDWQNKIKNREDLELKLIDAGADDILTEDEALVVYTASANLQKLKTTLEDLGLAPDYAETEYIARQKNKINDPAMKIKLEKLFNELDADQDINNYYTDAET